MCWVQMKSRNVAYQLHSGYKCVFVQTDAKESVMFYVRPIWQC
jgi:hypothetical protein